MIDMQMPTPHLLSLGGRLIEREPFELLLQEALGPDEGECNPFPEKVIAFWDDGAEG